MRTFSKTMRGALPAIGLGLISAAGFATVTAVTAPAAHAQTKAKKEFVEAYNAANAAMTAKNHAEAIRQTDIAYPHAADNQQKLALEQIRVQSYYGQKNYAKLASSIEAAFKLGGLPAETAKSFKQLQASAYAEMGNNTKAVQLTKEFVDQYGGSADQMAWLAQNDLKAKNWSGAVSYAQKAIDQARRSGQKPKEAWHKILIGAHYEAGNMDAYYDGIEKVVLEYPSETYWRALVERATREPQFSRGDVQLDMYRTLAAAGVKLKPSEQMEMAEQAMIRGASIEAESLMEPLFKAGLVGGAEDRNAERNKRMYANVQNMAKADKEGGLEEGARDAASEANGMALVSTGEAFLGAGEYAKAAELINQGLEKGQLKENEAALAKLRLGIAQFKAGQRDAARKTWNEIKAENGATALARSWILISRL